MEYPDCWKIVKIIDPEGKTHYRVAMGWYGGYLGSDSWQMNSGIASYRMERSGKDVVFIGVSGSEYLCVLSDEGLNGYVSSIVKDYAKKLADIGASIEEVSFKDYCVCS
jgi:hypothetical protein